MTSQCASCPHEFREHYETYGGSPVNANEKRMGCAGVDEDARARGAGADGCGCRGFTSRWRR